MIPFAKPSLNFKELNQIKKVMNSGILVHGNISQKFDRFRNLMNSPTKKILFKEIKENKNRQIYRG